jgi:hypothetical protein
MAGVPCIAVEIAIPGGGTIYACTHAYLTRAADTPASTVFENRLVDDVSFDRSVGCVFWGEAPRGAQNFGRIRLVNADGAFDAQVGKSFRDQVVVIKRGETDDAYSTFLTVATLLADSAQIDEGYLTITVKDRSARLERPLQTSLYPTTVTNQALRGKPRPITLGTCFQVPLQQPDVFGNGHFDLHDDDQWVGATQVLDQGAPLVEGTGYRRSARSGIYGIERLTAIGGTQAANVQGRFRILSTDVTDDFTTLAAWTETNGGIAGRDASIVSNELRLQNTAGGADLILQLTAAVTSVEADVWYYEFDCTQWTSGQAEFRRGVGILERTITGVGRYTGIFRSNANYSPVFLALNGSNCDLRIDNLRIRKVALDDRLQDIVPYLCTVKGPLLSGDIDTTAIAQIDTDTGYRYGFHASEPIQIADVLDQLATSIGGWWFIRRTGALTFGRLLAPTGLPVMSFDQNSVKASGGIGVRVLFDDAAGLSNVCLAKRNWRVFTEGEVVASLNYLQLNASDRDADVTLSNSNYNYSAANVGAVRSTPGIDGERTYFEIRITAIGAGTQHYVGVGNLVGVNTAVPGSDANSIAYRANGQSFVNGALAAYGTAWAVNDVIQVAVDGRPAAMGANARHYRVYFGRNGTWQNSSNPDTDTGFLVANAGVAGIAHAMVGGNAVETNAGTVNFGQSAFAHTVPAEYYAPAWHRQLVMSDYRFRFRSVTAIAAAYVHADAADALAESADNEREYVGGVPTLLAREADATTEANRWAGLYTVERFFYEFTALLDAGAAVDQLEPGDVISLTWPRFGLSGKLLRVVAVSGALLGREIKIRAWG